MTHEGNFRTFLVFVLCDSDAFNRERLLFIVTCCLFCMPLNATLLQRRFERHFSCPEVSGALLILLRVATFVLRSRRQFGRSGAHCAKDVLLHSLRTVSSQSFFARCVSVTISSNALALAQGDLMRSASWHLHLEKSFSCLA